MFLWNSLPFSMIQRMLAIWSLILLPFLKPAWTSGSSRFTYCWSLAWRILSITLLAWEELYKKDLHDPDNHDGVIPHLEPDILECEVKWALGCIHISKASGSDGIPVELFQILKDDAVKVLHSICQQIWKTQQGPQDWKRSVFIPIPKKGNAKECSNYRTIVLISHTSKVMLKILQPRLQQYVNWELPDVQAGFRKGRGTKLPTSAGSWKKQESSRKTSISALLTTLWLCGSQKN